MAEPNDNPFNDPLNSDAPGAVPSPPDREVPSSCSSGGVHLGPRRTAAEVRLLVEMADRRFNEWFR